MASKYRDFEIIPDVIDSPPTEELSVQWKRTRTKLVGPGNKVPPKKVDSQPVIDWRARRDRLYTVLFVHVGPQRVKPVEEELHWLVFNVPAENMMRGQVHAEYLESGPQKGTGEHRYVYLVFEQPSTNWITPKMPYQPRHLEGRKPWNTRTFAKEYGLGDPVAGNFYIAEWDESVASFRSEITGKTGHFLDG